MENKVVLIDGWSIRQINTNKMLKTQQMNSTVVTNNLNDSSNLVNDDDDEI